MSSITLHTNRLQLSPPVAADARAIMDACQDPAVQRWTTIPVPYSLGDADFFIEHVSQAGWHSGTAATWAIRLGGAFVGMIDLHDIADRGAVIGFWLAAEHRGSGLLHEAATAVLDYAFAAEPDGRGLQRVSWAAGVGNVGSARVAQRLGFRFEGTARRELVIRGERFDSWQAGLLPGDDRAVSDWPVLRADAG